MVCNFIINRALTPRCQGPSEAMKDVVDSLRETYGSLVAVVIKPAPRTERTMFRGGLRASLAPSMALRRLPFAV